MSERLQDIIAARKKKLEAIKKAGIDPYPSSTNRTHTNQEAVERFDKLADKKITLVGRLRSWRDMGKLIFAHIEDGTAKIQVLFKEDAIGKDEFKFLMQNIDIGDFVDVTGILFKTKTGEKTLEVKSYKLLAKTLRALPEKWHGLSDTETRLRKRYLDMIANPEVRELFRRKSVFWSAVRNFMIENAFLEVQTPVLENVPGGADAEPFVTHHNALDRDFYLRISLELPLKRLLVGGLEKIFEIGRLFRNEGIDREHLQEYDDMEFYWAYADHENGMDFVKKLFKEIIKKVAGKTKTAFEGNILDWGKAWPKVDYFEIFGKEAGLDLNKVNLEDLKQKASELNIKYDKAFGRARLIDAIYKRTVRAKLVQPCFLTGHPQDLSPLSKTDPGNPNKVLRFQVLAGGMELGNGWAELNDPIDQRQRFEQQMKLREAGDKEAQMMDEDFVEALEYGMPPAVGFGMSERLFAVLMDKSIRETVIFPPMRN